MARPVRLFQRPDQGSQPFDLVSVNDIVEIRVVQSGVSWFYQLMVGGITGQPQTFTIQSPALASETEAIAAAEVWRARVDDAP